MTGAVLAVDVRPRFYLDSVALMQISRTLSGLPGVAEAALMIGTDANKALLREAGLFAAEGEGAGPNDLIVAIRAQDRAAADRARARGRELLEAPRGADAGSTWQPKSLAGALGHLTGANLALISVPGAFAAAEARKALDRGLHVMLFSDNVDIAQEVELKTRARAAGLLVMGPDCGSALIDGVGLGFANAVNRGDVGIVAASGTGLQEVSCLVSRLGGGVSHAIGVGGRDLSAVVGGVMTAAALEALARDAATRRIVVVSKPPHPAAMAPLLGAVAAAGKPVVLCLIGAGAVAVPDNAVQVPTLAVAAARAVDREAPAPGTPARGTGRRFAAPAARPVLRRHAVRRGAGRGARARPRGGVQHAAGRSAALERGLAGTRLPRPRRRRVHPRAAPPHDRSRRARRQAVGGAGRRRLGREGRRAGRPRARLRRPPPIPPASSSRRCPHAPAARRSSPRCAAPTRIRRCVASR